MGEIQFRKATKTDINQIVDILVGDEQQVTTQVGIKLFGVRGVDQLKMIAHAMAKATGNWENTTVVEQNGEMAGFLQTSEASMKMTLGMIFTSIRIYGFFFMRKLLPRIKALNRVQTDSPQSAYKIAELHVAPEFRGRGIGFEILRYAENEARKSGYSQMSLQTWTNNPAIRLYERFGFAVVETSTDEEFEELTGVAGNKLLVKELD